jgi:hypothetical protein
LPLELRWIFTGQIPDIVEQWFYDSTTLGYAKKAKNQKYEDIYLYTPEIDYLSVKFREKRLGIKWRRSSFPFQINTNGPRNNIISGTIEDWLVWERKEKKATVDDIEEYIGKTKRHPWIKVIKERSRYKHRYKDGYLKQIIDKDDEDDEADCSIELVSLELEANKNIAWWSIGIDIFRDMNAAKNETSEVKGIIHNLTSNFPNSLNSS